MLQNQHCDLATISGISKFSGGQVQVFPGYHTAHNPPVAERFDRALRRFVIKAVCIIMANLYTSGISRARLGLKL